MEICIDLCRFKDHNVAKKKGHKLNKKKAKIL